MEAGSRSRRADPAPVVLHGGAAVAGCLARFVIVMLFLLFAFTLLLSVVGGSLLGGFYF
jgi:hypothetical protein